MIQEQDERLLAIRDRTGHRAFHISSALTFLILIWVGFSGGVGLPALSGTTLFISLLVVVVVPYLVYISSIVVQQNKE